MPTRMILELKYIDSSEVTIHVDAMLLRNGSPGSYASPAWLEQSDQYPYTEVGQILREKVEVLPGVSVSYGQYGFVVRVPSVFDLVDTLYIVYLGLVYAVDDDVLFATTLGDDAFAKPEFIKNPSRDKFGQNIDRMLVELRQRKGRAVIEAEQTIERLTRLLEEVRRTSQRQSM